MMPRGRQCSPRRRWGERTHAWESPWLGPAYYVRSDRGWFKKRSESGGKSWPKKISQPRRAEQTRETDETLQQKNAASPKRSGVLFDREIVEEEIFVLGRPGSDLLSQGLSHSTIGAEEFNGRVRDGIGFKLLARTTRPAKDKDTKQAVWSFISWIALDYSASAHGYLFPGQRN